MTRHRQPRLNRHLGSGLRTLLRRLNDVANLITQGGHNAETLATHLEVSTKTIYRDVDFLRDFIGAEIDYDWATRTYRTGRMPKFYDVAPPPHLPEPVSNPRC